MADEPLIAPSILAADFTDLATDIQRVAGAVPWLHLDVMDGHFVPNISFGPGIIKQLRPRFPEHFFDCHLMISEPGRYLDRFIEAGCDLITFHVETQPDAKAVNELIGRIHDADVQAGLSLSPPTPVDTVLPYLEKLDLVLVMTVHPGFGGQSFMEEMMPKVRRLRQEDPELLIEVDGGIGPETVGTAARAGANVFVAGTAIMKAADPVAAVAQLRTGAVSQ